MSRGGWGMRGVSLETRFAAKYAVNGGRVMGWRFMRGMHPYHFRSGQWAEILTIAPANGPSDICQPGDCYIVRFPDGVTDFWPIFDDAAEYEFAADEAAVGYMTTRPV